VSKHNRDRRPKKENGMSKRNRNNHSSRRRGPVPRHLVAWVNRWAPLFRAFYREALRRGYGTETVVWSSPAAASLDAPPAGFNLYRPAEARSLLLEMGVSDVPRDPAPAGAFRAVVSSHEAGFEGLIVGYLPAPGPDEQLPDVLGGLGYVERN
jgi:hypothetical protein